jgi:hypothetical protein
MKTLPKSLHTITAWVNLARHFMRVDGNDPKMAALRAECVLGLETMADYHGIKTAVLKQLTKAPK